MKRLFLALAAAALVIAACEPLNEPHPDDTGNVEAVYFGDSLLSDAEAELTDLYIDDSTWAARIHAHGGTQFDTQAWVDRYPSVTDGQTVILALGTNDIRDEPLDDIKYDARHAIDTVTDAGATNVVVLTLNETSAAVAENGKWKSKTEQWNDWLWRADASTAEYYRNLNIADWATFSAGHLDWLKFDGVHHNAEGNTAYAQFLYDARNES